MLVHHIENIGRIREEGILNLIRRSDPVPRAQNHRRSIQLTEGKLSDLGSHGLQTASPFAGIRGQQNLARLLDGFEDLLIVERNDASGIDDLAAHVVLCLQLFGGLDRTVESCSHRQDRQVRAFFANRRLAERHFIESVRDAAGDEFFRHAVQPLAFKEDDRDRCRSERVYIRPLAS